MTRMPPIAHRRRVRHGHVHRNENHRRRRPWVAHLLCLILPCSPTVVATALSSLPAAPVGAHVLVSLASWRRRRTGSDDSQRKSWTLLHLCFAHIPSSLLRLSLRPLTFICRNTPTKHPSSAALHPLRLCLCRPTAAFVDGRQLLTRKFPTPVRRFWLSASPNTDDEHPAAVNNTTDSSLNGNNNAPAAVTGSETVWPPLFSQWSPPRYLWRGAAVFMLAGQVILRALKGKIHQRNTPQQLEHVDPKSTGVYFLTVAFVGMAFTIQFVREFTRLGLNRSVGVLALAFSKGVGESTTSAVVISLVSIFIADFILSYCFFQGVGDSLKYAMG